jgi:hypothetical protein
MMSHGDGKKWLQPIQPAVHKFSIFFSNGSFPRMLFFFAFLQTMEIFFSHVFFWTIELFFLARFLLRFFLTFFPHVFFKPFLFSRAFFSLLIYGRNIVTLD